MVSNSSVSRCRWPLVAALLLGVLGCGPQGPFEYVPASGRVVYDDGSPVVLGKVIFQPQMPPKGDMYPRNGGADIASDGTFNSVTSYKPGDGLVPGKHRVAIMFAVDEQGKSLVPEKYTSFATTPLEVDTADIPFEIKVPKP